MTPSQLSAFMNYSLLRSRRKTISLEITPEGKMIVRAPLRCSEKEIQDFILRKQKWVEKVIAQQSKRIVLQIPSLLEEGTKIPLLGQWLPIGWENQKKPSVGENLVLPVKWKGPLLQKKLIRWLKSEAETYLTHRTKVWSSHINVPFQTVTITHAKMRLGSCNHKKQIRYTWRIMMLPPSLSDYIILHELAHIKVHSHGEAFWKILREWIPDLEERKNLLKQYIIH